MTREQTAYEPLTVETIAARLGMVKAVCGKLGTNNGAWRAEEVGDGNLNLVFIVASPLGKIIIKQALPYVRLVGDSWPLPLSRAFFEYQTLARETSRDPGSVPEVLHFDEDQALIVMEFLTPHVILRKKLIAGERVSGLADRLGPLLEDPNRLETMGSHARAIGRPDAAIRVARAILEVHGGASS